MIGLSSAGARKDHMRKVRLLAAALLSGIALAGAGQVAAQENETLTEQAKIEQIVHDYLLAHPEVVVQAIETYQAQQDKQAAAKQAQTLVERREELIHAPDSPVLGNPGGDVTVVEFFDYRCPYCKSVAKSFIEMFEGDGNVRVIFKEFPILGAESEFAAKAALAAQKQGKYRALHLALMTFKGQLTVDDVRRLAGDVGIDVAQLERDMQSPDIAATINRDYSLAQQLGIKGTPAFIVGNELIPGAISAEEMQKKIAAARKTQG
jgi:protein-disulfide isomerase